jgi:myo-inositol-1(or 4)-monophosphatase
VVVGGSQITARRDIAIKAATQAGRMLSDCFGQISKISAKGDRDLVTDIDLAAERIIKSQIIKNFPQDSILSEENPYEQKSEFTPPFQHRSKGGGKERAGFKWIIDPLDGTHNYIHNIDIFGVSIALAYKDEVVMGIIYMSQADELYFAQKNKGAYLNGKRISVSKRKIREATLIFDSSIRYQENRMLKDLGKLVDKVFNVRMFGSTVRGLTYIAEGKAEAEVEYNDKLWDFAAGLLLIEEAGGRCTDLSGRRWNIKTRGYIASNGKIHNKVLALIK